MFYALKCHGRQAGKVSDNFTHFALIRSLIQSKPFCEAKPIDPYLLKYPKI